MLVGLFLLREAVTIGVVFLVSLKAETDFQVAVLLLAVIGYRRLIGGFQPKSENEALCNLRAVSDGVSLLTDVAFGIALIVVIFR